MFRHFLPVCAVVAPGRLLLPDAAHIKDIRIINMAVRRAPYEAPSIPARWRLLCLPFHLYLYRISLLSLTNKPL